MTHVNQAAVKRRKVLFVVTKSNFGGAQRYVYDLATSLPKDRFEAVVLCGGSHGSQVAGRLIPMLQLAGIRTIFIPELGRDINTFRDIRAFNLLAGAISVEKPDILHLNSSKAGGLGALAGRFCRVRRIIFTAHGWAFAENRGAMQRFAIRFASWLTVILSHRTICVSEDDRDTIRTLPFVGRRISVIHNGIGAIDLLDRALARSKLFPNDASDHTDDAWLVTNAELHPNKNLAVAIDAVVAANALPGRRIFYSIISDGEERAKLEERIAKAGASGYITLLGFVDEARTYLRAFDIFLLPSKKEGLPYAILEAGRAALPTIASDAGGIPEVIEDNESGLLCEPEDVEGFAEAIRALADNPERARLLGAALEKRVAEEFGFARMIESTIALYDR